MSKLELPRRLSRLSLSLIQTVPLCALLWLSACAKHPRLATLPPPAPKAAVETPHETLPEPPAPETSPPAAAPQPLADSKSIEVPPPPTDPKQTMTRRRTITRAAAAPTSQPAAANSDPAPATIAQPKPAGEPSAPRLEQLLSDDEQRDLNRKIDSELQNARSVVLSAASKNLGDDQKARALQIESFIRQAEELRKTDLVEAKGLSHKADILAKDLAANFP